MEHSELVTTRRDAPALADQAATQIVERRQTVRSIVRELMVEDVHFGKIPGVEEPMLFKPGTNMLASAFGIALEYEILTDLSRETSARVRVRCLATSITSGAVLGSNIAEASQDEAAHQWRTAYKDEYDKTPEPDRKTFDYKGKTVYKVKTSIADKGHTILEVAEKRAATQVVSAVLGIDDLFAAPRAITAREYADLLEQLETKAMSVETARDHLATKRHFDGELWELDEILLEWIMAGLANLPDVDQKTGEVFAGTADDIGSAKLEDPKPPANAPSADGRLM